MIDPDFDPLGRLERVEQLTNQLIQSHKQNTELQRQIVEQINKMTEAINNHDLQINHMHHRVRLLEIVRQYGNQEAEDTNEDHQNADAGQQDH